MYSKKQRTAAIKEFRRSSQLRMFDACLEQARLGTSGTFFCVDKNEGVLRRCGASHRIYFWNGYDGIKTPTAKPQSGTLGHQAYKAGQKFRLENGSFSNCRRTDQPRVQQ